MIKEVKEKEGKESGRRERGQEARLRRQAQTQGSLRAQRAHKKYTIDLPSREAWSDVRLRLLSSTDLLSNSWNHLTPSERLGPTQAQGGILIEPEHDLRSTSLILQ